VRATGRSPFPSGPSKRSLGAFVGGFKSAVTTRINQLQLRDTPGVPVWQRNYYEHIIRNKESLNRIREYIADNPIRWEFDAENPDAKTPNKECLTEKRATSRSPLR
jgi:putative transposase